jgi:hypothetical protein
MKYRQAPDTLLMIRPMAFSYNIQTAGTNAFQADDGPELSEIRKRSRGEFDAMVDLLESHDIRVMVVDDTMDPPKPDAVFPNNWISLHEDGKVILYPMMATNRRPERRADIIDLLRKDFEITEVVDLHEEEDRGRFLEGTGSIVFDHLNRAAYACRSPRTDEDLVKTVCAKLGYRAIVFNAVDEKGQPVYHTNVILTIGSRFAVVCLDAIRSDEDQDLVLGSLAAANLKVVAISYEQVRSFAGNMIEVQARDGEECVLVSAQAFAALLPGQVDAITRFAEMIPIDVPTIEKYGGGSVRCMVAGIHLKRKTSLEDGF